MSFAQEEQIISGWGGTPRVSCTVFRPETQRELDAIFTSGAKQTYIARGLGRSYGDAAVNPGGGVIMPLRLNRMIAFDEKRGVLECESGVSLAEIIDVFLPRGFFLPVTPGTKFVTVGGAIAHDVHGKNHHRDGTFGEHVESLRLLTPTGEYIDCSPEVRSDVFWATVGGAGLTGIILSATIRLQRVSSAYLRVDYRRCANIDALLATIRETDEKFQYSVAWVDCLSKGTKLGRGVLMSGEHIAGSDLRSGRFSPYRVRPKPKPNIPVDFPSFVLNSFSIGAFNALFYAGHASKLGVIVDYDSYFYPLDRIHNWCRIYGKQGFTQYQATFPHSGAAGLVKLIEKLSASGRASFLAVLKRMGPPSRGLLSHPIDGWTLTLDIPMRNNLVPFLHACDELVLEHGGRLYMAKDVCTRADFFAAMYPRLAEFKAIQTRLDPDRKLSSRLARRCGIVEEN